MIVAVIVLYMPHVEHVSKFIKRLSTQVDHIVLSDNTPDQSKKYPSNQFDNNAMVHYVSLGDNYGIAKAQNVGIKKAQELGATYVITFDQDSFVEENFIQSLMNVYHEIEAQGHKIAALGPNFIDTKTQRPAAIIRFDGLKVNRIFPQPDRLFTQADYIISSGSLMKMQSLNEIGLMMEELFIDYVDLEWGLRAKKMGFSCFVADQVVMNHTIGDHSIKVPILNRYVNIHSDFRKYFLIRNSLYLSLYSDLPINWRIVQFPKTFLYFLFIFLFVRPRLPTVKIFFKAIQDALLKKLYKGRA